jgi:tetratricopeptide (TPR) repeat protein
VQVIEAKAKKKEADVVFVGPKEYKPTFDQSVANAKSFYDLYGKARESIKVGDYEMAIKLLNDSLPHVGIGIEKGMVYRELTEIYRDLGNLNKELKYIELLPKYTMNDTEKLRCAQRAEEIRSIMENPEEKNNFSVRFPAPPIYGRPFKNYREVVTAQADSKKYLNNAALLLRDKKYSEAIEEYNKAYYPDSANNSFIESGLIQCYRGLNKRKEALILIDYTLKNRNWAQENIKEFQKWREELI